MAAITLRFYEDELFSNWLIRYARLFRINNKRVLQQHLLGSSHRYARFTYDMPTYLNLYCDFFKLSSTPEQVLKEHTIFPFLHPFLLPETQKKLVDAIMGHIPRSPAKFRSGSNHSYLRYCPLCFESDLKNLGYPYWRCTHQVLYICPIHDCLIHNSPFNKWPDRTVIDIYPAELMIQQLNKTKDEFRLTPTEYHSLERLNNDILWIFNQDLLDINAETLFKIYQHALTNSSLTSNTGHLYRSSDLTEALQIVFSPNLLNFLNYPISNLKHLPWPQYITNRNRLKSLQPIQFLILIHALGFDLPTFLQLDIIEQNTTSSRENLKTPRHDISDKILQYRKVWTAALESNPDCNQGELCEIVGEPIYNFLLEWDKSWVDDNRPRNFGKIKNRTNIYHQTKAKSNDLHLAEKVYQTVLKVTSSKQEVDIQQISKNRLYKLIPSLHRVINYPSEKFPISYAVINAVSESRDDFNFRKILWLIDHHDISLDDWSLSFFIALGRENLYRRSTKLRWTFKRILEWVDQEGTTDSLFHKRHRFAQENWPIYDENLAGKVKDTAVQIREIEAYPQRVTHTTLGYHLNALPALVWHSSQIPQTMSEIHEVLEGDDQYAQRLVDWGKTYFQSIKKPPTKVQFIRTLQLSNLHNYLASQRVTDACNEAFDELK